jgi:hypothetical protein
VADALSDGLAHQPAQQQPHPPSDHHAHRATNDVSHVGADTGGSLMIRPVNVFECLRQCELRWRSAGAPPARFVAAYRDEPLIVTLWRMCMQLPTNLPTDFPTPAPTPRATVEEFRTFSVREMTAVGH